MKTRILALVLAMLMLLGLVPASAEELEHVTLDWYVLENTMPDNQQVFDALNAYFKEKINTTVNFHFYPGSEYATKMNTILNNPNASVDIVNTNGMFPYVDWTKKGAFVDMKELLPKYAPATWAMIPEGFWSAMTIDGGIYGIPSYKDSCQMYSIIYNRSLAEEIGMDLTGLVVNGYEDFVPYMYEAYEKICALHPEYKEEGIPLTRAFPDIDKWAQHEVINGIAVVNVPGIEAFEGKGAGETVFNKYDTQEYRDMCKFIAQGVRDGIFPTDCMNFDPSYHYSVEGKYLLVDVGSGYVVYPEHVFGGTWFTGLQPFAKRVGSTNYLHQAVECIATASKNPERAAMVLELVNTDPYVATTIRFGVEGSHWEKTENGQIHLIGTNADPANYGHRYWYGAQFGALTTIYVPDTEPANFTQLLAEANETAITDTNMGFIFDPSNVKNEIAACNNVISEFTTDLQLGYVEVEDVDAVVDEFVAKLNANGAEKIIAEAQAQLDAWRAVNK